MAELNIESNKCFFNIQLITSIICNNCNDFGCFPFFGTFEIFISPQSCLLHPFLPLPFEKVNLLSSDAMRNWQRGRK